MRQEIITDNAVIQPMSLIAIITVTPASVDLGTWPADGSEHPYDVTNVRVQAWGFIIGYNGNLYVRAGGDFTRGTDTSRRIALSNFRYECPGYVSKRPFTTTDYLIHHYTFGGGSYDHTYHMNYYITIPTGTDPGTYNTTIYYTAT